MHYSVHPTTPFIGKHQAQLLPDWTVPVRSVLILLQPCSCSLMERTGETEVVKTRLRYRFLAFANQMATVLQQRGVQVDMFDPCTGLPLLTTPGQARLSDVAVAHALLGYPKVQSQGCSVLLHPLWGSSVYPSTLVSSAEPGLLEQVAHQVIDQDPTLSDTPGTPMFWRSAFVT